MKPKAWLVCGVLLISALIVGQTWAAEFRASLVVGKTVTSAQGERLGKIVDIVIGDNGCVEYVILEPAGVPGVGNRLFPIPWTVVRPERERVTIVIDRTVLVKAPSFEKRRWAEFRGAEWKTKVQEYYRAGAAGTMPAEKPGMVKPGEKPLPSPTERPGMMKPGEKPAPGAGERPGAVKPGEAVKPPPSDRPGVTKPEEKPPPPPVERRGVTPPAGKQAPGAAKPGEGVKPPPVERPGGTPPAAKPPAGGAEKPGAPKEEMPKKPTE